MFSYGRAFQRTGLVTDIQSVRWTPGVPRKFKGAKRSGSDAIKSDWVLERAIYSAVNSNCGDGLPRAEISQFSLIGHREGLGIQEPAHHVLAETRDVVIIAIVWKARGPRNRADREDRTT